MPVDLYAILVVWVFIGLLVGVQRFSRCNDVTCHQRLKMLDDIREELIKDDYNPLKTKIMLAAIERVTYFKHLFALFLGRDPYALYQPVTFTKIDPRDID